MNEGNSVAPDLSYEPGIIGPLVPADILIFSIATATGFSAAQSSAGLRYAIMLPFVLSGLLIISIRRFRPDAGRMFMDFLLYIAAERFHAGRTQTGKAVREQHNGFVSFMMEEINFISAGQREKERFASAFVGACSTPGSTLKFTSLPAAYHDSGFASGGNSLKSHGLPDMSTGRKFMATVTAEEQRFYIALLSEKSRLIGDGANDHTKITAPAAGCN